MKLSKILLMALVTLAFTTTANADRYKLKVCERAETSFWDTLQNTYSSADHSFIESLDNMGNYSTPLLNRIVKSPYIELWVNESLLPFPNEVNVSNLIDHTLNQFYLNNTRAPSYLMRLAGNFGNSTYGIESFVNVLNDSSIWDYSEEGDATCAADYQFFVTGCTGDSHRIYNMNSRFYLDQEHLNDYDMLSINST